MKGLGIEHSMHLIPKAKMLAIVPGERTELKLYRFDPEVELAKSGVDYLIVTSEAPAHSPWAARFNTR